MRKPEDSTRWGRGLQLAALGMALVAASCSRQAKSGRVVWAQVDGGPIYRDEVEKVYHNRASSSPDSSRPEQALTFELNILNELIDDRILLKHASHAQVTVSEAEVDKKLEEFRSPYSKDEFQKKLQAQGLTLSDLRDEIRQSLTIEKLVNKEISSRISVSDQEIATYYNQNKANFNVRETAYHLAQILVTPVPDPQVRNLMNDDAKNEREAQRKIQAIYMHLKAGEDFAKIAQEYSEDPRTASGGGDMGFIPASSLAGNKQIITMLSSMKPGQVAGILHDRGGYHLIKLIGIEQAGQRQLSDPQVATTIRQSLMNEKQQLLRAAYIEDLRDHAKVVNYLAADIVKAAGNPQAMK